MDLFGGTIVIYVGVILSTLSIYYAVKRYGRDLVEDVVPEERLKKIEDKIEKNTNRFENTLFILYFLPAIPKDFLTYVGSLLPIGLKKFLGVIMLARFPAIISSTIVGSSILDGDVKKIFFVYGITYLISIEIVFIFNRKSKNKMIKEGQ